MAEPTEADREIKWIDRIHMAAALTAFLIGNVGIQTWPPRIALIVAFAVLAGSHGCLMAIARDPSRTAEETGR